MKKTINYTKLLSEALIYLRLEKRISRLETASKLGCTEQTLYLIEKQKFGSLKYRESILDYAKKQGFKF